MRIPVKNCLVEKEKKKTVSNSCLKGRKNTKAPRYSTTSLSENACTIEKLRTTEIE